MSRPKGSGDPYRTNRLHQPGCLVQIVIVIATISFGVMIFGPPSLFER